MKFLTKNSKILYMAYGILIAVMFLAALYFMTNYTHVHVYYTLESSGALSAFDRTTETAIGYSNKNLFDYFSKYAGMVIKDKEGVVLVDGAAWLENNSGTQAAFMAAFPDAANFATVYAPIIYNFQVEMSAFNDLIITFALVGICCFALLLVFANHSRRIYYKSNLVAGIILPLVVVVFGIVMIAKNVGLMNTFNDNQELFNAVSVLQNPNLSATAYQKDYTNLQSLYSCNSTTFIVFTALFAVIIIYSLFLAVYAFLKYNATAEERAEIIKKAVVEND